MKRMIGMFMAVLLVAALFAACGSETPAADPTAAQPGEVTTPVEETQAATDAQTEPTESRIQSSKGETYYENGSLNHVWDTLVDTVTGETLEGKEEKYYESGALWISEEFSYDEQTRTRTSSEIRYYEDGTEDFTYLWTEQFDEAGNVVMQDWCSYGEGHVFRSHSVTNSTYDAAGNVLTEDRTYYEEDGSVRSKDFSEYAYDEQGNVVWNSNAFLTALGEQERRQATTYTYDQNGKLTQKELVVHDAADVETFRNIEEYNAQGRVTVRTSLSSTSTQTDTYTYHEDGKEHTILTATTRKDDTVTKYYKITNEYYENGAQKSQTVQTWTSEDERNAAPGTEQSALGKTTVTEYDENGNRI